MPTLYIWLLTYLFSHLPIVARIVGTVATVPLLAAQQVPGIARVALSIALGVLVAGLLPAQELPAVANLRAYLLIVTTELAWGIALGLGLVMLLEAARMAGELLDLQLGFRAASLFDPISGSHVGIFSHLYYLVALLMFFQLNAHHWLLTALWRSFRICPVGAITYQTQITKIFAGLLTTVFQVALLLGGPALLAVFLTDLAFGLVSRMVPQMNVFLVGIPAKITIGLVAMILSAPLLAGVFDSLLMDFRAFLAQMMQAI